MVYGDYSFENHRLRQENEQLRMEVSQFHKMQETASPLPNYNGLQDKGHLDSQDPWDQFRFFEPKFTSQSVHLEIAELKHKLEQNQVVLQQTQTLLQQTQAELRLNQGDYERSHVELEQMQEKVLAFHKFLDKVIGSLQRLRN